MTLNSVWFFQRNGNPAARLRLYCLPYAGGGSSAYASWQALLGREIEVCPIVLPGREGRMLESPISSMDALVPSLAEGLAPHLTRPYALFGHSMGALIAFELARRLVAYRLPAPAMLLLSGAGPVRDPRRENTHHLGDAELLDSLRRMNGTPPEFFGNPELVELLLPTIRADLQLAETFSVPDAVRIPVPITAFAGSADPYAGPAIVGGWRRHAAAGFALHELPGDHFFVRNAETLVPLIAGELAGAHSART
ncbi:thioesterase II family protein [Microbispora siamensis]